MYCPILSVFIIITLSLFVLSFLLLTIHSVIIVMIFAHLLIVINFIGYFHILVVINFKQRSLLKFLIFITIDSYLTLFQFICSLLFIVIIFYSSYLPRYVT